MKTYRFNDTRNFTWSPILVLFLLAMVFTSGCRSNDGGLQISGGTAEERAMVHGAFNNMVPELQRRGFDRVRMPEGKYTLRPYDPVHVWRLPDGGEQGSYIRDGQEVCATGAISVMTFGRPLHPWVANHEVTHTLLFRAGYDAESNSHDKRAFDDRGHLPRGSRRVR